MHVVFLQNFFRNGFQHMGPSYKFWKGPDFLLLTPWISVPALSLLMGIKKFKLMLKKMSPIYRLYVYYHFPHRSSMLTNSIHHCSDPLSLINKLTSFYLQDLYISLIPKAFKLDLNHSNISNISSRDDILYETRFGNPRADAHLQSMPQSLNNFLLHHPGLAVCAGWSHDVGGEHTNLLPHPRGRCYTLSQRPYTEPDPSRRQPIHRIRNKW